MARVPIRRSRDRRRLSAQQLIAQVPSAIQNGFNDLPGNHVILTLPVYGAPVGLELSQFDSMGNVNSAPAVLTDPQTITCSTFTEDAVLLWVSNDGGLKTASNGGISGVPFHIT